MTHVPWGSGFRYTLCKRKRKLKEHNRKRISIFTHRVLFNLHLASSEELVNIIFAGDISFDGTVRYHVNKGDHTYNDSFSQIAPYITDADLAVVNFESPIITKKMRRWKAEKGPYSILLRTDAKSASSLRYNGS